MRRGCILVILSSVLILGGCNVEKNNYKEINSKENTSISQEESKKEENTSINQKEGSKFEEIKAELNKIPKDYSSDMATEDGNFVVVHGSVKSDIDILNKFAEDSQSGKEASIVIVQYTIEGDPIIMKIIYDGSKYYGVKDNTRDEFGIAEYTESEFKHLKIFEEDNEKIYYLLDEDISYKDLMKSLESSDSSNRIKSWFICTVDNKPSLVVTSCNKIISVERGGFTWEIKNGNETEVITTDMASAEEIGEYMKGNKLSIGSKLNLKFSENPQNVKVIKWQYGQPIEYAIEENEVILLQKEGEYIFEIIGEWEKGTVSYVVKILVEK